MGGAIGVVVLILAAAVILASLALAWQQDRQEREQVERIIRRLDRCEPSERWQEMSAGGRNGHRH